MIKAIITDLDGTLLDSLEDMKDSVNHVMRDFGYLEHTLAEVRSYIGDGIRKLIERALPPDAGDEILEEALKEYREYYMDKPVEVLMEKRSLIREYCRF